MHLLWRMLEVIVHGDDHFVAGQADTAQGRVMLPVIAHQVDPAHAWILPCQRLNDLPALVRAVIIDQDHLIMIGKAGKHSIQPFHQVREGLPGLYKPG